MTLLSGGERLPMRPEKGHFRPLCARSTRDRPFQRRWERPWTNTLAKPFTDRALPAYTGVG
jgi:hypothetical protein